MADVLILGCGPAGLLAAHAVERLGNNPVILSRKEKSVLPGAQYLHVPIPDLCDSAEPDGIIRTIRRGTAEGYARKVYGHDGAPTSWATAREEVPAWDLRALYDLLWERYEPLIRDAHISGADLDFLTTQFPLIISTIPAMNVCRCFGTSWMYSGMEPDFHQFEWESMYVIDWAPPELPDNTVLYSGDADCEWYRCSRVFGHPSSEGTQYSLTAPVGYAPEGAEVLEVKKGIKVVGSNCDCRPEIKRAGRYGTWRKGYLTHHAFEDATRYVEELNGLV